MIKYDKNDVTLANIAKIFKERLKKEVDVTLVIDESLGEFCGKKEENVLSAGSHAQLLDVAGRFLRNPGMKDDVFVSHKKMCGMYFATHFQNYLDAAPMEEIYRYIEDLAFWGMNTFKVWFDMHHFRNMEEGSHISKRLIQMMQHAREIGVKTWLTTLANEAFADSPCELRADWTCGHDGYIYNLNSHYHVEICPSVPGGMEQIIEYRRQMLEVFKEAQPDYVSMGPYDQGGCSCSACAPWGGNGYLRTCEALIPVIKEYMPNAKIIMSMWQFGTFTGNDVEFEGMQKAMGEGRFPDVEYIVAEPQYVKYPFENDMHKPLINFPEISMFGASPWGGYGANPLPKLFEGLWRKNGPKLEGGIPYSEGIYEDINKVIMLRLYRDNQSAAETVREYLAYEFGLEGEMLEKVFGAVMDMEETLERAYRIPYGKDTEGNLFSEPEKNPEPHRYVIKNPEKVQSIETAMIEVNESLSEEVRSSIKWQMLYLRALIDGELVRNNYYRNEKVLEYFKRIVTIAHLENSGPYTKPDIE